jgi:hypothetical protein
LATSQLGSARDGYRGRSIIRPYPLPDCIIPPRATYRSRAICRSWDSCAIGNQVGPPHDGEPSAGPPWLSLYFFPLPQGNALLPARSDVRLVGFPLPSSTGMTTRRAHQATRTAVAWRNGDPARRGKALIAIVILGSNQTHPRLVRELTKGDRCISGSWRQARLSRERPNSTRPS